MKYILVILFILSWITCAAQQSYIQILPKGSTYTVPFNNVVVMDDTTFAGFHYAKDKYDSLKIMLVQLDERQRTVDSLNQAKSIRLNELIRLKDNQILSSDSTYQRTKQTLELCIADNDQKHTQISTLSTRIQKQKSKGKIFAISTGILSAIIIGFIAK